MQQQLALAIGVRVGDVAMRIRRNVQIMQPDLAVANEREAIGQLTIILAKRADLRAGQHDTNLERFEDVILVKRLAVLRYLLFLSYHVVELPFVVVQTPCSHRPMHGAPLYRFARLATNASALALQEDEIGPALVRRNRRDANAHPHAQPINRTAIGTR